MTVDEILASGTYRDRRGREWILRDFGGGVKEWSYNNNYPFFPGVMHEEMPLFIERDMHRDKWRGIFDCDVHPVPTVFTELGWFYATAAGEGTITGERCRDLPEAMNAARALAVAP